MKVWISVDNPIESTNYRIICPLNGENPIDINALLDNNECEEIIVQDVLERIPLQNIGEYVKLLVSKLRHKGKLHISGVDADEVTKAYNNGEISINQLNSFLFGQKQHAWDFSQSVVNLFEVVNVLKSLGMKIIHKRLANLHYSVSVERP